MLGAQVRPLHIALSPLPVWLPATHHRKSLLIPSIFGPAAVTAARLLLMNLCCSYHVCVCVFSSNSKPKRHTDTDTDTNTDTHTHTQSTHLLSAPSPSLRCCCCFSCCWMVVDATCAGGVAVPDALLFVRECERERECEAATFEAVDASSFALRRRCACCSWRERSCARGLWGAREGEGKG